MAKMSIIFDGFEKMAAELDRMGQDLKPAVDEALTETQKYIQQNLELAAEPYKGKPSGRKDWGKGNMFDAIITQPKIDWLGSEATVEVGFSSALDHKGFLHSIFVMYGVPAHGKFNNGYMKDAKVYNAIRGTRTKKEIAAIQKEIMGKYLKMGR